MTTEAAIAYALGEATNKQLIASHGPANLTRRELQAAKLVAAGQRLPAAARTLGGAQAHDAAEALSAVPDRAAAEQRSTTVTLEHLLAAEVEATEPDVSPAGYGSHACPPPPAWTASTSTPPAEGWTAT